MTFYMGQEKQREGEVDLEVLKQRVFASAFGAFDQRQALKQYYDVFEKKEEPEYDYEVEEFVPENEADVQEMMNAARRAGAIR